MGEGEEGGLVSPVAAAQAEGSQKVGECGRVDMPGGNAKDLYQSFFNKLLKLNDEVEVYPGHDYGVKPNSTIGEERRSNYVLQPRTLQDFIEFMGVP